MRYDMPELELGEGWAALSDTWYNARVPMWKEHLVPRFSHVPCYALEVGSHEGRSAVWFLYNLLKHDRSEITCVDTWPAQLTEQRFYNNIERSGFQNKVNHVKGDAIECLKKMNGIFDFIYIDADHVGKSVIMQAALAWPLLAVGGVMVFDDYPLAVNGIPPKDGIDAFLKLWQGEYKILWKSWQVAIEKTR